MYNVYAGYSESNITEQTSLTVIQHYVIKFVSDLWQGRWFSPSTPVSSTNKTDRYDITEILLQVALNSINLILAINHI